MDRLPPAAPDPTASTADAYRTAHYHAGTFAATPEATDRPRLRIVVDDTISIHAYRLSAETLAALLPSFDPPNDRELISRRLIGIAQRTPHGWAVTTHRADTVLYHDANLALATILDLDLNGSGE